MGEGGGRGGAHPLRGESATARSQQQRRRRASACLQIDRGAVVMTRTDQEEHPRNEEGQDRHEKRKRKTTHLDLKPISSSM
jgi:hypothetical protein